MLNRGSMFGSSFGPSNLLSMVTPARPRISVGVEEPIATPRGYILSGKDPLPRRGSVLSELIDDLEQATRTMSSPDASPSRGRYTRWSDLADSLTRSVSRSAKPQPDVEGDVVVIINGDGTVTRVPTPPPSAFERLADELNAASRPVPKQKTGADYRAEAAARKEARRKREWQAYLAELRAIRQRERDFEELAVELDAAVR